MIKSPPATQSWLILLLVAFAAVCVTATAVLTAPTPGL